MDIHTIPPSVRDPEHIHYDIRYIFLADRQERLQVSQESKQLRWVPLSDLEKYTDDISIIRLRAAIFRFLKKSNLPEDVILTELKMGR